MLRWSVVTMDDRIAGGWSAVSMVVRLPDAATCACRWALLQFPRVHEFLRCWRYAYK